MIHGPKTTLIALALTLGSLSTAQAQTPDGRLKVAFGPAATTGAGDSDFALAASVSYRFSDRFSFEVDLTGSDDPVRQFSDGMGGGFRSSGGTASTRNNWADLFGATGSWQMPRGRQTPFGADYLSLAGLGAGSSMAGMGSLNAVTDGRMLVGTVGFRYDLPVQGGRLRPYVGGGIGLVRTETDFSASGAGLSQAVSDAMQRAGVTAGRNLSVGRDSVSDSMTHTGMAASAGIGASLRVFRELSLDIDARYFRLDQGRDLARFGGGVSYRF